MRRNYPACISPGPLARGSPEIARSPWPRGPGSWARTANQPSTAGALEYTIDSLPTSSGHEFRQIQADWIVPPKPISYTSGNLVYIFPALENNIGTSNGSIAQPVLQLGNNSEFSPGYSWIGALYVCQGLTDPCYYGSSTIAATTGDHLSGLVYASNCTSGKCDWTIELSNNTSQVTFEMTLTASRPTRGQSNDTYTYALGGALETYNLTSCDAFPAGGVSFSNIAVYTELGQITPTFMPEVPSGITPQCGYGVVATSTTASLADSATTSVQAEISGPSALADGASDTWTALITSPHLGTAPYTYSWNGILSGTGSSVSGVPSGTGTLFLEVRDATGARYDTSMSVTVCDVGVLIC